MVTTLRLNNPQIVPQTPKVPHLPPPLIDDGIFPPLKTPEIGPRRKEPPKKDRSN
jgi:hypothetical protein